MGCFPNVSPTQPLSHASCSHFVKPVLARKRLEKKKASRRLAGASSVHFLIGLCGVSQKDLSIPYTGSMLNAGSMKFRGSAIRRPHRTFGICIEDIGEYAWCLRKGSLVEISYRSCYLVFRASGQ